MDYREFHRPDEVNGTFTALTIDNEVIKIKIENGEISLVIED